MNVVAIGMKTRSMITARSPSATALVLCEMRKSVEPADCLDRDSAHGGIEVPPSPEVASAKPRTSVHRCAGIKIKVLAFR